MVVFLKAWILISAWASVLGWALSAARHLNGSAYVLLFWLPLLAFLLGCIVRLRGAMAHAALQRLRFRFRHFLPGCFLALAIGALVGGLLYPPTNHAGLTYRVSRVLQWTSFEQWFWIHTPNYRMNDRACGMEWLSVPLLLLTKSDRLLFLLNFVPFLLLPGLVFSLFTLLGVARRTAWNWMWLLPSAYNFLLQAGSIANDTFPTVYALAAVDFGLRAQRSRSFSDVFFSVLSAALLTGAKASNLPLLLPWAILMVPTWSVVRARPGSALLTIILAAVVSFIPTAVLNQLHCGDWSGLKLERAGMEMHQPIVGIWGNGLLLLLHNFVPPFFPQASWWNQSALTLLPAAVIEPMKANFEAGFHLLWEMPTEDWVGLGFGVSLLTLVSFVFGRRGRRVPSSDSTISDVWLRRLVLLTAWIALLFYCMKSGMVTGARLISPYYPLLLPVFLLGKGQDKLVRTRWWRTCAALVMILAIPVLVLTPARPLFPAMTVWNQLAAKHPGKRLIERAQKVYATYRSRSNPLAQVRDLLPSDQQVVGFLADGDDMDISLWRPYYSRVVKHILLQDPGPAIRNRGIVYAAVGGAYLDSEKVRIEDWMSRVNAELVGTTMAIIKVTEGPQFWYVVRFR